MPVLQQFLGELFEASPNYSLPFALEKLRAFGGISSMLGINRHFKLSKHRSPPNRRGLSERIPFLPLEPIKITAPPEASKINSCKAIVTVVFLALSCNSIF